MLGYDGVSRAQHFWHCVKKKRQPFGVGFYTAYALDSLSGVILFPFFFFSTCRSDFVGLEQRTRNEIDVEKPSETMVTLWM